MFDHHTNQSVWWPNTNANLPSMTEQPRHTSRSKLLGAALQVIREKGYTAATVDEICEVAGVTKGSFFHHFKGKEDLALSAVEFWNEFTGKIFAEAPYQKLTDPKARVLGYIDYRAELLRGELPEFTCLLGTMVQETYDTHPALRDACNQGISNHAKFVAEELAEAKERYAPSSDWKPETVALFTQAVIQGAFILAKSQGGPQIAADCIAELHRYVEMLLTSDSKIKTRRPSHE